MFRKFLTCLSHFSKLRDIWASESSKEGTNGRVEVLSWLSKMTLDVIGLAGILFRRFDSDWSWNLSFVGFNYHFDSLSNDPAKTKNELNEAFSTIFRSGTRVSIIPILRATFPALRFLVCHFIVLREYSDECLQPADTDAETKLASERMTRIGNELLRESKNGLLAEDRNVKVEKTSFKRRDLLSLLLRANMSTDLPANQRMSDEDVLSRTCYHMLRTVLCILTVVVTEVPTFIVAGHETTRWAVLVFPSPAVFTHRPMAVVLRQLGPYSTWLNILMCKQSFEPNFLPFQPITQRWMNLTHSHISTWWFVKPFEFCLLFHRQCELQKKMMSFLFLNRSRVGMARCLIPSGEFFSGVPDD